MEVDDQLRVTAVPGGWLYAAGDVNGRALLTHQGKYQARLVGDTIAGKDRAAWADHVAVPQVVFTDPEMAAVGLTEQQAREQGLEVKVVSFGTGAVAGGALVAADPGGKAQPVIDQSRRVVVGATFVGPQVGEMLHAATIAIVGAVAVARGAGVPDGERGLVAPAGGGPRPLRRRSPADCCAACHGGGEQEQPAEQVDRRIPQRRRTARRRAGSAARRSATVRRGR